MPKKLYIVHIQFHGLITQVPELGFDSDTGGQISYVLDLAAEQAKSERVEKVEIVTRLIVDEAVKGEYAVEREKVGECFDIVRLSTSPVDEYIHKEKLWGLVPLFTDMLIDYFRKTRFPDVIHAHYADAGLIASILSGVNDHVTIFTGHSLGISKKQYLLKLGETEEDIEKAYNISKRIHAEEIALLNSHVTTSSSFHEKHKQFFPYMSADQNKIRILSPGVDLQKFGLDVPLRDEMKEEIEKFFTDKSKPIILAITRPVKKKNIHSMIKAYGKCRELQEQANLCLILGTRDYIEEMDEDGKDVLIDVLVTIDQYDLYGKVAYPKTHKRADIPAIYNYAYKKRGIFTNIAYTEPFGLTALEASASGLPCLVTKKGGVSEIISIVANGLIVDPNDLQLLARCSLELLSNEDLWNVFSKNGLRVDKIFSWESHVKLYLKIVDEEMSKREVTHIKIDDKLVEKVESSEIFIFVELDDILQSNSQSIEVLSNILTERRDRIFFGITTGRSTDDARDLIKRHSIPCPEVIISNTGTEISFSDAQIVPEYRKIIGRNWDREYIKETLQNVEFLDLQASQNQTEHKISYTLDYQKFIQKNNEDMNENGESTSTIDYNLTMKTINNMLLRTGVPCNAIFSHNQFIDILPGVANKGNALRFLSHYLNVPLNHFHTFGCSNNDHSMLTGWINGTAINTESKQSSSDFKLSPLNCAEAVISLLQ